MTSYGMASPTGIKPYGSATGSLGGNKIPKGYRHGQINQYTPEQNQLFKQSFNAVSPDSYTGRLAGGDEDIFNEIEAPAYRQFNENIGGLASRFSGMGAGARRSSGFQNMAGQLGSNFAQDLASRRSDLQRQAIMDLHNMSQQLLGNRPYEQFLTQKPQKTSWAETIGKLGGAIPGLISSFAGGGSPADALKGAFSIFGGNQGTSTYGSNGYNALPGLEDAFRTGNYGGL